MIKLLLSYAFNFYQCRYSLDRTFSSANAFNQPLTDWDTARVTDMGGMLGPTSAFNGAGLIGSNTSSVRDVVGWCKLEVCESRVKCESPLFSRMKVICEKLLSLLSPISTCAAVL